MTVGLSRQAVARLARDRIAGAGREAHVARMARKDQDSEERLAAALRENLKRRKAQARDRRDDKEGSPRER